MPKFTRLHFLLGTGRPEDREEAIRLIRDGFARGAGFPEAAERVEVSERQLRRYCNLLGIDPVGEAGAKRAAEVLSRIRGLLAEEKFSDAQMRVQQMLGGSGFIPAVEAEARCLLAQAQLGQGQEDAARDSLRALFRTHPDFELPPSEPAAVRKLYAEVLEEIAEALKARARRLRRGGGQRPGRG